MTDRPHLLALDHIASIDDPIRVTDDSGNPHLHYSAQHVKAAFLAGVASWGASRDRQNWRPFVHQRDAPTDGTWFVARSTRPGWEAVRVVRYADKSHRLPTDGTGWMWPSEPMEWLTVDEFAALNAPTGAVEKERGA